MDKNDEYDEFKTNVRRNSPMNELNISLNDGFSSKEECGIEKISPTEEENMDKNEIPPDLFDAEDEFNVEDAIEEDDDGYEPQNISEEEIPASDELNWDDFEIVDEIDSGENTKNEENKIDSNQCELQQISDDEHDETCSRSRPVSIITSVEEENMLSCQNSLSPTIDAQICNVSAVEATKITMHEEVIEKVHANSMEVAAEPTEKIEDAAQKPTTSDNECQIVQSEPTKLSNSYKSYVEIDSDVLEITVSRGEDLEMNDVDHFSNHTESKKDLKNEINDELNQISDQKISSDDVKIDEEQPKKEKSIDVASTKRAVPLQAVALFVESLAQLTFDWKKYTCFYCNPCQSFVTSTSAWEDHVSNSNHKKNNFRWKACHDLLQKEKLDCISKHQSELERSSDFIAGPEFVIEICGDNGQPRQWFCQLCNSVVNNFDFLLNHLSGFGHIDNFMEKMLPDLYTPPGRCSHEKLSDNIRVVTDSIEKRIMGEAKKFVQRKGIGKMKSYKGEMYRDSWGEVDESQIEMEEQVLAQEVQRFFNEDQNYGVKCDLKSSMLSVANNEYRKMDPKTKNLFIGLQYLLEIWLPSRRVIPVWYCILCDSLVTNWSKHCEVVQHIAAYLNKHYKKPAFDPAVLEANDEEELRNNFIIAKTKVLQLEEYSGRVNSVVQIMKLTDFDSFVAINAIIAKQIINHLRIRVSDPPRPKRPLTSKEDKTRIRDSPRQYQSSSQMKSYRPINSSIQRSVPPPLSARRSPIQKRPSDNKLHTDSSPNKTPISPVKSTKLSVTVTKLERTVSSIEIKSRDTEPGSKRMRTPPKLEPKKRKSSPSDERNNREVPIQSPVKTKPALIKAAQQQKAVSAISTSSAKPPGATQTVVRTSKPIQPTAKPSEKPPASLGQKNISAVDASVKPSAATDNVKKNPVTTLKNIQTDKPAMVGRSHVVRTSSLSETRRRESEKSVPKKRISPPKRSPPRRRRSSSRSSKRRRRESHSPPRRRRPSEATYRRRPSPLPVKRISPPRRRIVSNYEHRRDERHGRYESSSRRERSRSRSRDVHRRPKDIDGDYRRERRYYDERRHDQNPPYDAVLMAADVGRRVDEKSTSEPVVVLSNDHLAKFTALLRSVGVDLGRQINMGDLDGLRERLGSLIFDQCLAMILNQSLSMSLVQQQQNLLFPEMFDVQHEQQQQHVQYDDHRRRGNGARGASPPRRPTTTTTHENQDYYRHRSPQPPPNRKQNRDIAVGGSSRTTTIRNRSPPQQSSTQRNLPGHSEISHYSQHQLNHPLPTPTSLVGYFNNRSSQVVPNLSGAQQQQAVAMQNIVSNFLASPTALFNASIQLGQQQATYVDPNLAAFGNENAANSLWASSHSNAQARW